MIEQRSLRRPATHLLGERIFRSADFPGGWPGILDHPDVSESGEGFDTLPTAGQANLEQFNPKPAFGLDEGLALKATVET
jgi:hypothetical protein